MSGLLRNLARRIVAGEEPVVHARSRLPFQSSVPPQVEEAATVMPAANPRPQEEPPSRSPAPSTGPLAIVPGPVTTATPHPAVETTTFDPPRPVIPTSGPETDSSLAPRPLDTAAMVVKTTAAPPGETARPSYREGAPPPVVADHREDPPDPDAPRPSAVATGAVEPHQAVLPEPLLDRQAAPPAATPAGPSGDAAYETAPARADRDEPPAIHIHIGRIEVAATAETTPRRGPRQPDRKPMSLEAYLARREGRTG